MNRSPKPKSSLGSDVMNIANRIRELAMQLEKEQQTLKIAKERLGKLKEIQEEEQGINDHTRRKLLQVTNARNEVELEIFAVRDQITACQNSIDKNNQEREELEEKFEEIQDEAQRLVETIYAPQQLKMELYLRALEGVVHAKRDMVQKRMDRLAAIRSEAKELKVKEKAERKEAKQLEKEIAALTKSGKDGIEEEIEAIADHNKNLIEQRRALRIKLDEVQKVNNEANAECMEWEEKRINHSTFRKT